MQTPKEKIPKKEPEYVVITDTTNKVILSTENKDEAIQLAKRIRDAGGQVTIFRSITR